MNKFINKELFLIAEVSANHNGSLCHAKKLINIAKRCGADAVKFQLFKADQLYPKNTKEYKN